MKINYRIKTKEELTEIVPGCWVTGIAGCWEGEEHGKLTAHKVSHFSNGRWYVIYKNAPIHSYSPEDIERVPGNQPDIYEYVL